MRHLYPSYLTPLQRLWISSVIGVGVLSLSASAAEAAYPNQATFDLTIERYSLLLETDRSSCAYYANPNTLQVLGEETSLSVVKMVNRERPGTACNGVFDFQAVRVKCAIGETAYSNSVSGEVREWEKNPELAQKVCDQQPYDREVFALASSQYSLLLSRGRDSCATYADPSSLRIKENDRELSALIRGDEKSGTACNGLFEFKDLTVRCNTAEVSFADHVGSVATWVEDWQKNANVAQKICALPTGG